MGRGGAVSAWNYRVYLLEPDENYSSPWAMFRDRAADGWGSSFVSRDAARDEATRMLLRGQHNGRLYGMVRVIVENDCVPIETINDEGRWVAVERKETP